MKWIDRIPVQSFLNTSEEVIPPYACMELDYFNEGGKSANAIPATTQDLLWRVKKPTSAAVDDPFRVVFNGPTPVVANGYGAFTISPLHLAAFDDVDGAPSVVGSIGPKASSWYLTAAGTGFVFASYDSGLALYESSSKRSVWVKPKPPTLNVEALGVLAASFYGSPAVMYVTVTDWLDTDDTPPVFPFTVINRYNWDSGAIGSNIHIRYRRSNDTWVPVQMEWDCADTVGP